MKKSEMPKPTPAEIARYEAMGYGILITTERGVRAPGFSAEGLVRYLARQDAGKWRELLNYAPAMPFPVD